MHTLEDPFMQVVVPVASTPPKKHINREAGKQSPGRLHDFAPSIRRNEILGRHEVAIEQDKGVEIDGIGAR
jgi:hypothetical protein